MELNFFGVLKIVHPIAKRMALRGTHGRICLIGDPITSYFSNPGMSQYGCSKAALEQLAYQLKAELEANDIKIHYFMPPPMDTNLLRQ